MLLRAIAGFAVLTVCLGSIVTAQAQYYPGTAREPAYRPSPPIDDDLDEPDYLPPPPGLYGRAAPVDSGYPSDSAQPRPMGRSTIDRQALPPPGLPAPAAQPGTYAEREPHYAPPRAAGREPYVIPSEQRAYEPNSGARTPSGPSDGYAPPPAVRSPGGQQYDGGYSPPRPPMDITMSERGPILDLNRPTAPMTAPQQPLQGRIPSLGANAPTTVASLPPDYEPEVGEVKELAPHLRRQLVDYPTREPAGTIVIDTPNTYLYMVLGNGKAMRYGIGVGREGFTWTGTERVSRMAEWPDWHPPAEMIERQPYLPRFMAGGETNPLGARALYLGKTLYRIHGTNQPSTIGTFVSSGCIRLVNDDVADLYSRVQVGTRVVVLPGRAPTSASAAR